MLAVRKAVAFLFRTWDLNMYIHVALLGISMQNPTERVGVMPTILMIGIVLSPNFI